MERSVFAKPLGIAKNEFQELGKETFTTSMILVKITVPVIIITKILEYFGAIDYLSKLLEPLMQLMGLPGACGIVWATGLFTTLYGAMAVFAAIAPGLELTTLQVTVLGSILLVAHSLPIEITITKKAGAGVIPILILRLGGALCLGILMYQICSYFQVWNEPAIMLFEVDATDPSLIGWARSQVINLGLIFLVIFCILALMRLLKVLGVITLLEFLLKPVLPWFGMTYRAAPVTVVGMLLGLGYGGALIIRETTAGKMQREEVFNSLALMSLSHGLVEDTLLMMALGGTLTGLLWGRLLFSLVVMAILVRLMRLIHWKVNGKR